MTLWSTWVQSVEWIDTDRERRFRDELRGLLWPVLGLRQGGVAVDVGCGGGALTRALARWMGPRCVVIGIDRDVSFLAYARQRARETRLRRRVRYVEGDALALSLAGDSVDVVTSYTVIEHVPDTKRFLSEEVRVCRPGGRVSVMEVRSAGGCASSPLRSAAPSRREQELWKPLEAAHRKHIHEPWRVGANELELAHLPVLFEELGLGDVMIDAFPVVHSLEDARVTKEEAGRRLATQERWLLSAAERSASLLDRPLRPGHLASLRRCIRARYRKQRRWIEGGVRTWDFSVGLSLIVSGRKP